MILASVKMSWVLHLCVIWGLYYVNGQTKHFRLTGDVIPKHYDLSLIYDIDPVTNFSYFGSVVILLTVNKPVSKVVLHAHGINIDDNKVKMVYVSSQTNKNRADVFEVTNTEADPENQSYTIFFLRKLIRKGQYQLSIPFNGHLKMHDPRGVYINHYENKETMYTEYSVATHFEPIYARSGFPCFDEPQYKATFKVSIGHHKDFHSLSNMPVSTTSGENALQEFFPWVLIVDTFMKRRNDFVFDYFETSKPMSTYLVAFSISKYVQASKSSIGPITSRVWARRDVINLTTYAATVAPKILGYYEKFFNIAYHLPKLDHVFHRTLLTEGMENWGHINYLESFLLDERTCSQQDKMNIFQIMSHEVSHQWFGNLVTMKWWSELWLKEGYAIFAGTLSANSIGLEEFKNYDGFISIADDVLAGDSLESSMPISSPMSATQPSTADAYSYVTYPKAAMLFRMLYITLGERTFKEALYNYLRKYSYKVTEQDDLWFEMDETRLNHDVKMRSATVKSVMDSWTTQSGYPLIIVERDYEATSLSIVQKRYLSRESKGKTLTATGWWIPLTVLAQDDEQLTLPPVHWLTDNEGTRTPHQFQHKAGADDWLVFNINMTALCRVNYDTRNWKMLSDILRSKEYKTIPKFNRAQLITDSFELAKTGDLDYSIPLRLAKLLSHEEEFEVLMRGYKQLRAIDALLKHGPDYDTFHKYLRSIIEPPYKRYVGLSKAKAKSCEEGQLKRELIAIWACEINVPHCQKDATALFEKWINSSDPDNFNQIPNFLSKTVFCWGVSRGGEENWKFLLERSNIATASEQVAMMTALACTREPWLMHRTLDLATSGQYGLSIVTSVVSRAMQNPLGYMILKNKIYKKNGDFINRMTALYKKDAHFLTVNLVNEFHEQEELDEFMTWRDDNVKVLEAHKLRLDQAVEQARNNIVWLAKHRQIILDKIQELMSENEEGVSSKETHLLLKENKNSKENKTKVRSLDIKSSKAVLMKLNVLCYGIYVIGRIAL